MDSTTLKRVCFRGRPVANPTNVIVHGNTRFTVLTPRLLRLEWSETGIFEDRSTYAFPSRFGPQVPFITRIEGQGLVLDTGALVLRYTGEGPFDAATLSITFELDGERKTWTSSDSNSCNLRGTRRTLDGCAGAAALQPGILSRDGWALFDDSHSALFDAEGWVAPRPDHAFQDMYFFGYGRDYMAALGDYVRFGGPIPLIPRFMLGAWWSRYWAYSAEELQALVDDFETHELPLDVLVLDMDWHTPHSWTGYTWNRELFPDPPAFLEWAHARGLRVTLNLHPAEGVQHFEEVYPRFAAAMGLDPQGREPIPFRIADRRFVHNYFELLHHPLEDDGVDFWWIDWQQGAASEVKGLDPLPWINHLHFRDAARRGRRSLIYSRWGGLGNHRYPIGFSGDTFVTWEALRFQPYFTATASNVGFGWWSHDIGGHMGGATEPELYARWVQFGALSPCLRFHSSKDPLAERRPWKYPDAVYRAVKAAFRLRYQLVPYIYTFARVAHDTGVALCRPMYYEYPHEEAAYAARTQYLFGDQMIAAPIVHPADPVTGLASTDVWVPPGTWIDYQTKETFTGPRWVRLVGGLDRVPMLVREGGILPLAEPIFRGTTDTPARDLLVLSVFPGAQGQFRVYEDDGISEAYCAGEYEWTEVRTCVKEETDWTVIVGPVEGRCRSLPDRRRYEVHLQGSRRPEQVTVDGQETDDWSYDAQELVTIVRVGLRDKCESLTVTASRAEGIVALGPARNAQLVREDVRRLLGDAFPANTPGREAMLEAALRHPGTAGEDALARLGGPFVHVVELVTPETAAQQLGRVIVSGPAGAEEVYDLHVDFTCTRSGHSEHKSIDLSNVTVSCIFDVPFAFDGAVETGCWEATVRLNWRGQRRVTTHCSQFLFPSIYAWRLLIYDQEQESLPVERVRGGEGFEWQDRTQRVEAIANLNQPHAILFWEECPELLKGGREPAAYLATTVVSPDDREARLMFPEGGEVEVTLNGQVVPLDGEVEDFSFFSHPFLRRVLRTAVVRLQAGENELLVHTRPPAGHPFWWHFGALFVSPEGKLMDDLRFFA